MEGARSELNTVLMLFRKDLRLDDNPALLAALQAAKKVIPVFVWSPEEEGQFSPGRCSRWWIKRSVQELAGHIAALGSRLIVRRAQATVDMLLQLLQETGAEAVFFNHLFDPISLVRDHVMKQQLTAAGAACRSYNADLLYEPWTVLDSAGEPFTTFKAFSEQLRAMPQPPPVPWPAPAVLPAVDPSLQSTALDDVPFFSSRDQEQATAQLGMKWAPGPDGGMARLEEFLHSALPHFSQQKARVDRCVSSRLSPWVQMGSISTRVIYYKVQAKQQQWLAAGEDHTSSCHDFLQQLAYREYSRYLSFHFPFMHERPLLSHLRCVAWNLDQGAFKAWKMGMSGYPLVDAAMKQLWSTGWMHNRLRVVCGVFAVKYLLLPWQWGLKHYWDQLLDADLESDALGWQYLSGCMADAPPFGQWLDITAEAVSFDPDGEYVRRWLPVLARMPTAWVHAPWTAPQQVLDAADVELGFNYPHPIVSQEDAAVRLEGVAAAIQQNLQQQQQQQQQSQPQNSGSQPQPQQQPSGSKQPYRPPTQPTYSYSKAHHTAAAAAAADMQQQHSSVVLPQQQQQQGGMNVHAAAAAAAGAQRDLAPARSRPTWNNKSDLAGSRAPLTTSAAAAAAAEELQNPPTSAAAAAAGAAAAARQLPWQQQQQQLQDEWQVQALQNDGHLRHEHQQQQQQQRQQHVYGSRKRRRRQLQQYRFCRADEEASGDDRDAFAAYQQRQRCNIGYDDGMDSDGSEVNSNAPLVSEAMPTACSGIVRQQEQDEGSEEGGGGRGGGARGHQPHVGESDSGQQDHVGGLQQQQQWQWQQMMRGEGNRRRDLRQSVESEQLMLAGQQQQHQPELAGQQQQQQQQQHQSVLAGQQQQQHRHQSVLAGQQQQHHRPGVQAADQQQQQQRHNPELLTQQCHEHQRLGGTVNNWPGEATAAARLQQRQHSDVWQQQQQDVDSGLQCALQQQQHQHEGGAVEHMEAGRMGKYLDEEQQEVQQQLRRQQAWLEQLLGS